MLARAHTRNARLVLLEVRAGNAGAIALYRAAGFEVTGERRAYYANGEDALLMAIELRK